MSTVLLVAALAVLAAILIWLSAKTGVLPEGWSKWVLAAGTALAGIVVATVGLAIARRGKAVPAAPAAPAAPTAPADPAVPAIPSPEQVKDLDDRAKTIDQKIKNIRADAAPEGDTHVQGQVGPVAPVVDDDALGDFVRDREAELHGKS